jgi:alkylation response protein AidB-like acyl-CoA dehydrogenase
MPHTYRLDAAAAKLSDTAAALARDVARPHAAEVDAQGRFPQEAVQALKRSPLFGLCLPTAVGGSGQGPRTFAAVAEELAQGCASTTMIYVMHTSAAQAIAQSVTLRGREALLGDIAAGRHLTTLALSEAGSRSNFWAPVSTLKDAGNHFTTSARKSWVTSAGHADSYVSSGQRPQAGSPLESTVYLIRRGAKGVSVSGRFDGLGLRGNDSAPVTLEDVVVTRDDLVSDVGAGAKVMLEVVLPWFAIGTAAMAHGLCLAATAATIEHLQTAGLEHQSQKLRDLPQLRARVAQMHLQTERSRALLCRCLDELEAASPATPLYVLEARASST